VGDEQSSTATGLDVRLVGVCAVLWVVAGIILWQNWPDTKKDYYWGNIAQGLEASPPRYDNESIAALAAMGDSIIPACSNELAHHWNYAYRLAVLRVLEQTKGAGAHEVLEHFERVDLDARVRANALLVMRARAKTNPAEAPPLMKLAQEVALSKTASDPEPWVRATGALILAESGDNRGEIKALLVFALHQAVVSRTPFLIKDMSDALAKINPEGPRFLIDKPGKELAEEIVKLEDDLLSHDIAIVGSRLTIAAPSSASEVVAPVSTGK